MRLCNVKSTCYLSLRFFPGSIAQSHLDYLLTRTLAHPVLLSDTLAKYTMRVKDIFFVSTPLKILDAIIRSVSILVVHFSCAFSHRQKGCRDQPVNRHAPSVFHQISQKDIGVSTIPLVGIEDSFRANPVPFVRLNATSIRDGVARIFRDLPPLFSSCHDTMYQCWPQPQQGARQ